MMDDHKNSDNYQGMVGSKMISPHHFHPTNGVRPSDSEGGSSFYEAAQDEYCEHGKCSQCWSGE